MSRRLLLASTSPRRLELLASAGFEPEVVAPGVEERPRPGEAPETYVARNALEKARAALALAGSARAGGALVLAADTIVVDPDGNVLEKPAGAADARRMLEALSGREHRVLSAYAILDGDTGRLLEERTVEARVVFRTLDEAELATYVATGDPLDKAGAYAIQGRAASFVLSIDGSFTAVAGLPLAEVVLALRRHGAGAVPDPASTG